MKIVTLILGAYCTGFAQSKYDSLERAVNNELQVLYSHRHEIQLSDSHSDEVLKHLITLFSNQKSINYESPVACFGQTASYGDSLIRFYNLELETGGSPPTMPYPIIHWRNPDGTYGAYNLSKLNQTVVTEIYKLHSTKNLYLVLGVGYSTPQGPYRTALVIKFNKQYLILDHPAFFGNSFITTNSLDFSFNEKTQELTLESIDPLNEDDFTLSSKVWVGEENMKKLFKCFDGGTSCTMTFDGAKFVFSP